MIMTVNKCLMKTHVNKRKTSHQFNSTSANGKPRMMTFRPVISSRDRISSIEITGMSSSMTFYPALSSEITVAIPSP